MDYFYFCEFFGGDEHVLVVDAKVEEVEGLVFKGSECQVGAVVLVDVQDYEFFCRVVEVAHKRPVGRVVLALGQWLELRKLDLLFF